MPRHHPFSRRTAARLRRRALRAPAQMGGLALDAGRLAADEAIDLARRLTAPLDVPLHAFAGWRHFATGPYRRWAALAAGQGVVGALAGPAIIAPLLLSIGLSAAGVTIAGVLLLIGPAAQLAVPALLRASNGNLRRLTMAAAAAGETRGFWLAGAAALSFFGVLPVAALVPLCALALAAGGVFSGVAAANLQAWMAATLPERERRFVAPRMAALSMAAGAAALILAATILSALGLRPGQGAYALLFAGAAAAGTLELVVLRRLPRPGKVTVPHFADAPVANPEGLRNFLNTSALASAGAGLAPYMSVYAIAVLGAGAGVAVSLSAVTAAAAVIAGVIAADLLAARSSSRFLRASWLAIGVGWLTAFAAAPIFPFALPALFLSSVIVAAGAAVAQIAVSERLFRLAPGASAMAVQGRFVALSAGGTAGGQLAGAAVLALGPASFPAFAALFALSAGARFGAGAKLQVAESWASPTGAWRHEDLGISQAGS